MLRLRYGLDDGVARPFNYVAAALGLPLHSARALVAQGLGRLQHGSRAKLLAPLCV